MQYIITLLWSFMLITMLNYVVSAVLGVPFDFVAGAIISVAFAVIVLIFTAVLPTGKIEQANHH